ncbi:MAG: hypothetical protein KGJ13_08400 [Patescibacteria group bacterium]|nr:hypothetical protein [Patescibacteria group bacterium]
MKALEERIINLRTELADCEQKLIQRNHKMNSRREFFRALPLETLIDKIIELEDEIADD